MCRQCESQHVILLWLMCIPFTYSLCFLHVRSMVSHILINGVQKPTRPIYGNLLGGLKSATYFSPAGSEENRMSFGECCCCLSAVFPVLYSKLISDIARLVVVLLCILLRSIFIQQQIINSKEYKMSIYIIPQKCLFT